MCRFNSGYHDVNVCYYGRKLPCVRRGGGTHEKKVGNHCLMWKKLQ